jgi:hypothetical protein
VAVRPGVQQAGRVQASPPTTADCQKAYKVACCQPARIQQAYDLLSVYASGVTGRGATIASELASVLVAERSFCPERALVRALVTA